MRRGLIAARRAASVLALLGLMAAPGAQAASPAQDDRAAAIFAEADAMLRLGDEEGALERFERLLVQYPAAEYPGLSWRAAARVRRGDVHWRRSRLAAAGADWVDVIDFEPLSSWTSRARLGLASLALAEGDWLGAADQLQRVVQAAQIGSADADVSSADEALRQLTLLHRFRVRPANGEDRWSRARVLRPGGASFDRPVALAVSADGQLLVVDEGMPAVLLVDAAHSTWTRLNYNEHSRPWWGPDGLPYLPTHRAGVIALGGTRVGFLAAEGGRPVQLKALEAGGRTPAGDWFLLDTDPPRVLAFGPAGAYLGRVSAAAERPVDVAVDSRGRLYALEAGSGTVVRYGADASREGPVAAGSWRRVEALAVDGLDNIYVLDRDARTIDVFDSRGQRLWTTGPALPGGLQLRAPRDIDVDGVGRIYVADRGANAVVVIE